MIGMHLNFQISDSITANGWGVDDPIINGEGDNLFIVLVFKDILDRLASALAS